jgi:hypothetical protein
VNTITTLDAAGRRRSPATYPDYLAGRPPKNKGRRYPADPPRVEEIMAVMREAGERATGIRLRGLIVVLWRAGLRISGALALAEGDLEPGRGAMLVRRGKGGATPRSRHGRVGLAAASTLGRASGEAANGTAVLRSQGTDRRSALVGALGPDAAPPHRGERRGTAALRAAPAPSRPRGGDGARGSVAERDPAPARSRQPRHHLHLFGGDRRRRDHRDGSRPARTSDPGGDGAPPLAEPTGGRRTIPRAAPARQP